MVVTVGLKYGIPVHKFLMFPIRDGIAVNNIYSTMMETQNNHTLVEVMVRCLDKFGLVFMVNRYNQRIIFSGTIELLA